MAVRFTSATLPPSPGLDGSCEIPVGCIISSLVPFDLLADQSPETDTAICLTCLSHLNPYCPYDATSGRWTCSICGYEDNAADPTIFASSKPGSAIVSDVVQYVQPTASAYEPDGGVCYVIVFDGNIPPADIYSVIRIFRSMVQADTLQRDDSIGLIVFNSTVSIYQLGLSAGVASADIYSGTPSSFNQGVVGDDTDFSDRAYLGGVARGGLDALERCADAFFGFDGDNGSTPSSNGQPTSRREMLRIRREMRKKREACLTSGNSVYTSDISKKSPIPEHQLCKGRRRRRKRRSERNRRRCTGEAVRRAVNVIALSPHRTGRVLLFTNGCPNHGPGTVLSVKQDRGGRPSPSVSPARSRAKRRLGAKADVIDPAALAEAVEYFQLLGNDAFEAGIGIDAFCTGTTSLAMQAFQCLVAGSDGFALTHPSLSTEAAEENIKHVVQKTYISRAVAAMEENRFDGCVLDIRTSLFMTPTNVVGPGTIEYDDARGVALSDGPMFARGASMAAHLGLPTNNLPSKDILAASLTRIQIRRCDPLMTHTLMLQVNDDLRKEDKFGVFQFVVRRCSADGRSLLTRVITRRLPLAQGARDFVSSAQDQVTAVLLAKEAVFRSIAGRGATADEETALVDKGTEERLADEARADIDSTVRKISASYRLLGLNPILKSKTTPTLSSLDFAFPPELVEGLSALHHIRRGPMLGMGPVRSVDDRTVARFLFLRLPFEDCLYMMAPRLWSCQVDQILQPTPPCTLALWDDSVLAVDFHDELFIWSGQKTLGPEFDAKRKTCYNHLLHLSRDRFPRPVIHFLKEGDSMSRRVTARLAPAHMDPPEHQIAYFPALQALHPTTLQGLISKFRFSSSSDPSFRAWFWKVAAASSKEGNHGVSLCK